MQWFLFQEDWFDRKMEAIADSETTVTFCFTPNQEGTAPHHASPPRDPLYFADFWRADDRKLCAGPSRG